MRGEPGRGGAGRGMLPGLGRWPMPCELEYGLLPGRGVLGREPMPWLDENGLLPGRGAPGRGMLPEPEPEPGGGAGAGSRWGGRLARSGRSSGGSGRLGSGRLGSGLLGSGLLGSRLTLGDRHRRLRLGPPGLARRRRARSGGARSLRLGGGRLVGGEALSLQSGTQLACYRRLDAGGRSLDELAHLFEFRERDFAVDAELARDLVYAWFCSHNSPVWAYPRQGRR